MKNWIFLTTKLSFNELENYIQFFIYFFIILTIVSCLIFLVKIPSVKSSQDLIEKYNKHNGVKTSGFKLAFFIISPYYAINKDKKQIIPYYIVGKTRAYHILEAIWWGEYAKWYQESNKWNRILLISLRFGSTIMAFGTFYTLVFWAIGIAEFQRIDFVFITIIMWLWSIGFGILTTAYIHGQISYFLQHNKTIIQKDKRKLITLASVFWLWQFANTIFELFRAIIWIYNWNKFKNIKKK